MTLDQVRAFYVSPGLCKVRYLFWVTALKIARTIRNRSIYRSATAQTCVSPSDSLLTVWQCSALSLNFWVTVLKYIEQFRIYPSNIPVSFPQNQPDCARMLTTVPAAFHAS